MEGHAHLPVEWPSMPRLGAGLVGNELAFFPRFRAASGTLHY